MQHYAVKDSCTGCYEATRCITAYKQIYCSRKTTNAETPPARQRLLVFKLSQSISSGLNCTSLASIFALNFSPLWGPTTANNGSSIYKN